MTYSVQWQTAQLFWWGNCIFSLYTSWQSALSLGKTSSCTAEVRTILQAALSVFLKEKTDPSAQPAGCWQHHKQGRKSQFVCKRGNKNKRVCCWTVIFLAPLSPVQGFWYLSSPLLHVYNFVIVSGHIWGSFAERWQHLQQEWKWEMLSGTLTLSRAEPEAVKWNQGQSGDKDALWERASEHMSSKGQHKEKRTGKLRGVGKW